MWKGTGGDQSKCKGGGGELVRWGGRGKVVKSSLSKWTEKMAEIQDRQEPDDAEKNIKLNSILQ